MCIEVVIARARNMIDHGSRRTQLVNRELKHATTATATKTSLENKHGDCFVIFAPSSHPLFLIEHAGNGLVEAPSE